jgi:hypothetical protein
MMAAESKMPGCHFTCGADQVVANMPFPCFNCAVQFLTRGWMRDLNHLTFSIKIVIKVQQNASTNSKHTRFLQSIIQGRKTLAAHHVNVLPDQRSTHRRGVSLFSITIFAFLAAVFDIGL